MAMITNYNSNKTVKGTNSADTISNWGAKVVVNALAGDDSITNHAKSHGSNGNGTTMIVTINGGDGADTIDNSGGSFVTLNGEAGNDYILSNDGSFVTLNGETGNDTIVNSSYNAIISGGAGNDSITNWYQKNATITGGKGNDSIRLLASDSENNLIRYSSGDGNDYIEGFDSDDTLTISGGSYSTQESGYDFLVKVGKGTITLKNVYATSDKVRINGKSISLKRKTIKLTADSNRTEFTRDSISVVGSAGNDSVWSNGSSVTINTSAGDDTIQNGWWDGTSWHDGGSNVTINSGAGNDHITNYGSSVTINAGAGNDSVWNGLYDKVKINSGAGNDSVSNYGDKVTITGGTGNDTIYNNWDFNSNAPYSDDSGANVLFKYNSGDGNDIIYGFRADSTLSIGGGSYSTKKSGDNVIVTVGDGKISLMGAASLSAVNITGTKATSTTTLTVTDKTKSPVTVGSAIKTINASTRTKAVKITGNKLANTIKGGSGNDIIYGKAGNDSILGNDGADKISGGSGNDTLTGGKGNDSLWGNGGKDTFIYASGDGKDVIYGFENDDMLKITGNFSSSYSKSKGEIAFKVGNTYNAITLSDFSATSFNVNGTNYKISGSKLVKK